MPERAMVCQRQGTGSRGIRRGKGCSEIGLNGDDEVGVFCDVRYMSLRLADYSHRAVLLSVIKLKNIVCTYRE